MIQAPELTGVMMSNLFWLTDVQMARLQPFFPKSHGKPRVDDRRVLNGIIFINRNGLRWCDAPKEYGPAKTLYNRWKRWGDKGIFARMMEGLASEAAVPKTVMIDATYLKAHRTATSLRSKRGARRSALASDRSHKGQAEHQASRRDGCEGLPSAVLHDRGPDQRLYRRAGVAVAGFSGGRSAGRPGLRCQLFPQRPRRGVGDAPMLPELLAQISDDRPIGKVRADGAYDTRACREAMAVLHDLHLRQHFPFPG